MYIKHKQEIRVIWPRFIFFNKDGEGGWGSAFVVAVSTNNIFLVFEVKVCDFFFNKDGKGGGDLRSKWQ